MNGPTKNSSFTDEEIIDLVRSVEAHDAERIAPPPLVWNNILAELEVEVASQEATARSQTNHAKPDSWFSPARLLSIAAATLLMVGVAVAVVSSTDDTSVTEVAAAMMTDDGLPVATAESADARFVCEGAQECYVEVDLTALPDAGADNLELWVINGDVSDMYSLGLVTNSEGRFDLPPGVTAEDYPIVDISVEPDDGDETHSGQSVLRGVFAQP